MRNSRRSQDFLQNKGFTLIEVLIVIAILALMSVTAVMSTTSAIERIQFQTVFSNVENLLFDARSMALKGKKISDSLDMDFDDNTDEFVVAAGYGLHIDTTSKKFTLFSDAHDFLTGVYNSNNDVKESEYQLPSGYEIELVPPALEYMIYLPSNSEFMATTENGTPLSLEEYSIIITIKLSDKYQQKLTVGSAGVPMRSDITTPTTTSTTTL